MKLNVLTKHLLTRKKWRLVNASSYKHKEKYEITF